MNRILLLGSVVAVLSACQMPVSEGDVGEISQAVIAIEKGSYPEMQDRTGRIVITIHWSLKKGGTSAMSSEATVSSDEVVVGGGAALWNSGTSAFLTGSYPLRTWNAALGKFVATGWRVEAKEMSGGNVNPQAFVVGMKLKYWNGAFMPKEEVQRYVQLTVAMSAQSSTPSATALSPAGYNIISGGARVYNEDDPDFTLPNFLTGSFYDSAARGWTGHSRGYPGINPAKMISYAISIPLNSHTNTAIPNFGDIRVTYAYPNSVGFWYTSIPTYRNAAGIINYTAGDSDWCPTGVGAWISSNGTGRLLKNSYFMSNSAVYVTDKDPMFTDWGTLGAQRISIEFDDNED